MNDARRGKRVRALRWLAIGLLSLAGAWAARAVVVRRPAAAAAPEVVRVARQDLESIVKATGVIRPVTGEVRVGSRGSGVVRHLHVRIGDRVVKGQLLAELDTGELAPRRDQAAASLASARAAHDYAVADLARKRRLAAAAALPSTELELAERSAAVAGAAAEEARANLAFALTQLAHARIEAPIAGVVSSIKTQEGETVRAGEPQQAGMVPRSNGDWNVTLGLGVAAQPIYPGAKDYRPWPIPLISIRHRGLFLVGSQGFGMNAVNWNGLRGVLQRNFLTIVPASTRLKDARL